MNAPLYIDTSALAKLILDESEGPVLEDFLRDANLTLVSSQLTEVELVRAVARSDQSLAGVAMDLLKSMVLLPMTSAIRKAAGTLEPAEIRSLDAIHLATAIEIQKDLAGVITYDKRMRQAVIRAGIKVLSPA